MKKIITQELTNKNQKVVAPSKQTVDFLKQFARAYSVQKELPTPLCGVCVN